jgi:uncharacterized phage protein (TIGR01671 family)
MNQREIKFRAWNRNTKKMVYASPMHIFSQGDYEIMQYTGLKEKNGKELFEGDIVEWDDGSDGKWRRRCEVGWNKAHYTLIGYWYDVANPTEKHPVSFNFGAFAYEKDGELEVIGNVYENPEFLEKPV